MSLMLLVHLNSPGYSRKRCFITYKCFTQLLKWNAEIYTSSNTPALQFSARKTNCDIFRRKGDIFHEKKAYFSFYSCSGALFKRARYWNIQHSPPLPLLMAFLKAVDNNDFTVIAISVNSQKRCKSRNGEKNVLPTSQTLLKNGEKWRK